MTRKILGIETSCDETAVAIVTEDRKILANIILSQKDHKAYGGVVPEVAARAHLGHLSGMIGDTLHDAGCTLDDINAVAVTAGPGLIGGVMVGVMTAKAIAAVKNIPLLAVNHLEGHALTATLTEDIPFPYLLLLVSGGHCQILVVEDVGHYTRLGGTIDDAVGECFDKVAKMMSLGYPGGPAVEKMAAMCKSPASARTAYALPRPFYGRTGCDFSFSGLKTAVKRIVDGFPTGDIPHGFAADLCCAFQQTVAEILCDRLQHGFQIYLAKNPAAPALVVAGGVAANAVLRGALQDCATKNGLHFCAPPVKLCTDNAVMIAWAGALRLQRGLTDAMDFPVRARWPLDEERQKSTA